MEPNDRGICSHAGSAQACVACICGPGGRVSRYDTRRPELFKSDNRLWPDTHNLSSLSPHADFATAGEDSWCPSERRGEQGQSEICGEIADIDCVGVLGRTAKRGSLSLPIFAQQGRAHIRGDRPRWRSHLCVSSTCLCVFDLANRCQLARGRRPNRAPHPSAWAELILGWCHGSSAR
jgi:hypothetical protein